MTARAVRCPERARPRIRRGRYLRAPLREIEPVALAGGRIDAGRTGGAETAAERIHAEDEVAAGVDGQRGTDHALPPAWLGSLAVAAACAEGDKPGKQQYRVVARGIEPAPAFVGDARAVQFPAAIQRERIGQQHACGDRRRPRAESVRAAALRADASQPSGSEPSGDTFEQRGRQIALAGVGQHRQDAREPGAPRAPPAKRRRRWRRARCRTKMPSLRGELRAQSRWPRHR